MSRYIDVDEFSQNLTLELYTQDDDFFTEEVAKAMDLVKRAEVKTETADVVSKDVYDQIKWERDVALDTLREHGLELGERADKEVGNG